ncbi:MAG: DUF937 domain-containing protein [Actinomycetes bacterium]
MSAVDDILRQIPLSQLAAQLGTDEQTAEAATRSALPALLGGLQANAQDSERATSLDQALGQHSPSLIDGGVDLNQVDTNEGEKIVSHIFGGQREAVANELGAGGLADGALGSGMVQRLLPILAPIVMSYLAKQLTGQAGAGAASGGLGGVLGSVLGGGGLAGGPGAGGLGDVLGGLLGQGRR